jgi:hypothetical protein
MDVTSDFSRFKNNELKSYFNRKDIEYYIVLKEQSKIKTDAYIIAGFSFLLEFSQSDKISVDYFSKIINNEIDIFKVDLLIYIAIPIIIGGLYYTLFTIFFPAMSTKFKELRNSFGKTYSVKDLKKFSALEAQNTFKHEVINQLAVALEMSRQHSGSSDTEKIFHINQVSDHVKSALKSLSYLTVDKRFIKELTNRKDHFIHRASIKNALDISSLLMEELKRENSIIHSKKVEYDVSSCELGFLPMIQRNLPEEYSQDDV